MLRAHRAGTEAACHAPGAGLLSSSPPQKRGHGVGATLGTVFPRVNFAGAVRAAHWLLSGKRVRKLSELRSLPNAAQRVSITAELLGLEIGLREKEPRLQLEHCGVRARRGLGSYRASSYSASDGKAACSACIRDSISTRVGYSWPC